MAMTINLAINSHFERASDVNTCKVIETLESFSFHPFVSTLIYELCGILDVIVAPAITNRRAS